MNSLTGLVASMYQWFTAPSLFQKAGFFRLLSVAQKAGVGLRESLQSIYASEKHAGMKAIIKDMVQNISQGKSLAMVMEIHVGLFGAEEIELVRAAETMGTLPNTLDEIAEELESMQKIVLKLRSTLAYPMALIGFTICAVIVLMIYVIPTIVSLFPEGSKLPAITVFIIALSDFLKVYRFAVLSLIMGIIVLLFSLYQLFLPFKIFIDRLTLQLPILRDIVKTYYLYRFSKLLGDFYKAGVSPVVALHHMSAIFSNYWYKKKVMDIQSDIESGFQFSESMEGSFLFDELLIQIMAVGENTGNVGLMLRKMANYYKYLLQKNIGGLLGFLEPVLMGLIAIVIGVIVAAVFLPMADLVTVLGNSN